MTEDNRLQQPFERALELDFADQRNFLLSECGGDPELLDDVLGLLAADEEAKRTPGWRLPAMELR